MEELHACEVVETRLAVLWQVRQVVVAMERRYGKLVVEVEGIAGLPDSACVFGP